MAMQKPPMTYAINTNPRIAKPLNGLQTQPHHVQIVQNAMQDTIYPQIHQPAKNVRLDIIVLQNLIIHLPPSHKEELVV